MKKYLFRGDYPLSHFFETHKSGLKIQIYKIYEDTFLELDSAYFDDFAVRNRIIPIVIYWDQLKNEDNLGSDNVPGDINIGHLPGSTVPVVYVKYYVPHNGKNFNNILSYYSNQYDDNDKIMWSNNFDADKIRFNIYAYGSATNFTEENKKKIVDAKEKVIEIIKNNISILNSHIEAYNSTLRETIENIVQQRKSEITRHQKNMQGL